MDKKIDIQKKYVSELMEINNKLNQLEQGRIYDLTKVQMDGYLSTNVEQQRKMLKNTIKNQIVKNLENPLIVIIWSEVALS